MATTRLMPLATCKGRTVGQGIRDIIDYTENPQKRTAAGRLRAGNATAGLPTLSFFSPRISTFKRPAECAARMM